MEEAQFRFGDSTSADLKLWLTGPNEEKYEGNPVYLHSAILKRSKFFEVMMSERWSSENLTEISVTTSHNFDDYLKCVELVYGESVYFTNVEECLTILPVASELMADELMNKCMEYLQAVRWSAEQESKIRDVLSSLGLKLIPDLTARLDKECVDCICYVVTIIKGMVSLVLAKPANRNKENAEKYIRGVLEGNAPRNVVELLGREVLQRFKSSIQSRDFAALTSLGRLIEHCEGEILKAAYVAFVEDPEFTENLKEEYRWTQSKRLIPPYGAILYTIILFMKAIGDGKIIISISSRSSFVTTWLPVVTELCYHKVEILDELAKAAVSVIESLPIVDKMRICVEWIKLYTRKGMDISTPLTLFKDLHDTQYK